MPYPLTLATMLQRNRLLFGRKEVDSRDFSGIHWLEPDFVGKGEGKEILDFLAMRVAKWWIPDEVIFIDAIPKTSVGKFAKWFLRDRFKEKLFA